jgi:multidrug resistance efflux pump
MQWDQVQSQFDSAQVGVQQAEVAVNIARKALTDLTVRSPIDGVIASKLKSDGEMATTTPPTIVVVVQNQSFLDLRFRLPERALGRTRVGDEVTATFDALGITQKARITRVLPAVDARTRTIEAVAEIANRDGALKSGLLATVDLAARQEIPERAAEVSRKKTAAKPEPPILESAR